MSNLPKGWEEVLVENVFDNIGGTSLEKFVNENGKYKFISIGNYSKSGKYIDNSQRIDINEKSANKILNKNDLVMVLNDKTSTGDIIGSSILIEESDKYIYNQRSERLICKNNIYPKFAWQLLNSKYFRKKIVSLSQGGTQIYINFPVIKKINFYLPPLEEQKKIADILSTVDKKIAFVEENINATEELKKGLMQKLLTEGIGHTEFKDSELGRLPESWEIDKLENLTTKIGDGLHGTPKYVEQSDYYFINGNNLNGESIEINKNTKCVNEEEYIKNKKILDNTTILLSINGTVGSLAYYNNENVMLGKSVAYMNVNSKILKQFLFYLLKSSKILEYFILELTGTTIKNLSLKTIRNTRIPLPQLEEQKQIAEILLIVDKKLESLKEKKQSFEELKKGLMQKLLTGEVRV
ncbi:restriction endonuclease subunit S [Aliarcobacter butzleri]|uniref:restriction endonuclease subunit S n=1 Tax=Aliarcobacter butzleri TaxID=28197 RepID=UPI001EDAAC9C|nr:restriction endonuclease subunit S [Aliarcobacter butzleri]MCG3707811.1 restriction endonuclease subunit S [Aliarcobacter butzleri]MCT7593794.1 restriction endonuclease subunit S [Aliarcobacter butzleri]MCT7598450.1 restriction endonuclease subunit S [Aliarcobacter butzleri]MCT7652110.1 restriction endonuclease subunit S [Aliarcobacter butzleri]UWY61192.1 restriction endonuclease subunit S [Aliarcobacter butzleri]